MALYNYYCDEVKRIIDEVSPNYPQLTTYEKEWLYFYKYGYIAGIPVDLEYQTVIINPTASVPNAIPYIYKSAILKGNTLINIISDEIFMDAGNSSITNITELRKNYLIPLVKTNTNYLVSYELTGDEIEGADASNLVTALGFLNHNSAWSSNMENQPLKGKLIINSGENPNYFRVVLSYKGYSKLNSVKINVIEYQNGMENCDISYFEGMKSVQMPVLKTVGKNLWCGDKDVFIANGIEYFNMSFKKGTYYFTGNVDTVYPNGLTTIVFSNTFTGYEVGAYINLSSSSAILKEDCNQVIIYTNGWSFNNSANKPQTIKNLMLSDTYSTSYEPYKSNILTVNEDVTLRSNGDVYDELNLLTGRLTQRIDENNEVLAQAVVKTVDLTPLTKPYEDINHYQLTANIPCEAILEVPVVSTGEQTLQEIND